MALTAKTKETTVRSRNLIKLPASICEECGIEPKGSKVQVYWGKNFQCVVITPVAVQLGKLQEERIQNLVNEPLDTSR